MPRFLLLLLCLSNLLIVHAYADRHSSVRFKLIRAWVNAGATRLERLRALLKSDAQRQRMISESISKRRQHRRACEIGGIANAKMPMMSGAYTQTGQYFVQFRVGTPAQRFLLVADTGSDLTWVKCRYRARARGEASHRSRPFFRANASNSFHPIPCSSEMCTTSLPFSLTRCPTPAPTTTGRTPLTPRRSPAWRTPRR